MTRTPPETLVDALQSTALTRGDDRGIVFYASPDSSDYRGYAALDEHARTIAQAIAAAGYGPGDAAVVALQPGLAWADGLYGALYAGLAIVPTPAAGPGLAGRITGLAVASKAAVLIADASVVDLLGDAADDLGVAVLTIESLLATGDAAAWEKPAIDAGSTALLMFTSGSTGDPKGVIGTHGGLLASAYVVAESMNFGPESTFVGWLPMHHAMGLCLEVLTPATAGVQSVATSPEQFQRRPLFWLQLISDHRGTATAAGNFAFGLCAQLATDEQIAALDLSSLEWTISGSEPVRPETVQAFLDRFASTGLRSSTIAPALGMTEAMLITMKPYDDDFVTRYFDAGLLETGELVAAEGDGSIELVSVGHPLPRTTLKIVDPDRLVELPDGQVGELWISSPVVSPGYFERPEATAETFGFHLAGDDRSYMRSGDLAATLDGELYVTGRLKEVIIIRGRNIYPQDIEAAAAALSPALGIAAAFELSGPRPGVGVVVEVDEELTEGITLDELSSLVTETVTKRFSIPSVTVSLTPIGSLPRTPTGKIRRKPTRQQLDNAELVVLHPAGVPAAASASAR